MANTQQPPQQDWLDEALSNISIHIIGDYPKGVHRIELIGHAEAKAAINARFYAAVGAPVDETLSTAVPIGGSPNFGAQREAIGSNKRRQDAIRRWYSPKQDTNPNEESR